MSILAHATSPFPGPTHEYPNTCGSESLHVTTEARVEALFRESARDYWGHV